MSSLPLVTRFAPSPTGHLHVGGARTALFCWAFARKNGGRFMIRIEDTDQARSSDESARGILDDLAWLGIDWDDGPTFTVATPSGAGRTIGGGSRAVGPYFQARRVQIYNAYIEHLVRLGRAYPAFETSEELELLRKAAVLAKQTYRYQRPADVVAGVFNAARWARACAGERHVVRFVMPDHALVVADQILGDVTTAPGEVDDFVVRKADGFPTYHFAVVIDDELMGVTHVLRAQEHLTNTPKHVALQGALTRLVEDADAAKGSDGTRFRTPVYAHLPLIFSAEGGKMSKRDKSKTARKFLKDLMGKDKGVTAGVIAGRTGLAEKVVSDFLAGETDAVEIAAAVAKAFGVPLPEIDVWDYRASGYLPGVLINYLALLGWSAGLKNADGTDVDRFDLAFVAEHFSVERVGKKEARFDRAKLMAFNADAIGALSDGAFVATLRAWAEQYEPGLLGPFTDAQLLLLAPALKPRCKVLRDCVGQLALFTSDDGSVVFDQKAVEKHLLSNDRAGLGLVRSVRETLAGLASFDAQAIDGAIEALATARSLKMGEVAQPLRVALTGTTVSPPLGLTMAVFGRARVIARLDRCLASVV